MCYFTRVTYECGHKELHTSPKDTLLCRNALEFGLRQGFNTAPASCFPLKRTDVKNDKVMGAKNNVFIYCDACLSKLEVRVGRDKSNYTENDYKNVRELAEYIQAGILDCDRLVQKFLADDSLRHKLKYVGHAWLRDIIAKAEPETLNFLVLEPLLQCEVWRKHLSLWIKKVPKAIFLDFYKHMFQSAEDAFSRVHCFTRIVESLFLYNPASTDYKATISYYGDKLQQLTLVDFEQRPDSIKLKKTYNTPNDAVDPLPIDVQPVVHSMQRLRFKLPAGMKPWLRIKIPPPMRAENLPEVVQVKEDHLSPNNSQSHLIDRSTP